MTKETEQLKNLEQRMRVLEDVEAIRKLKARYAYAIDSQVLKDIMNNFALECSADYGPFGNYKTRSEVEHFFGVTIPPDLPFTLHWLHNGIIDVNSEITATGQWYFTAAGTHKPTNRAIWMAGKYNDDFIKENDEWKIKKMLCTFFYITAYDEGWVKEKMTLK